MDINAEMNPVNMAAAADYTSQPPEVENDFAEYPKAKLRIDRLIADFEPQCIKAVDNREKRFKDVDIDRLKKEKLLNSNEYLVPMRVIDSNIRREQPSFFNYLKASRRLIIFKDLHNDLSITNKLEDEFSRGMTYSGWEIPHFKVVDGSQTHGWDSVEVEFNTSKPLHCGVEHIGNDNLIFPTDAIDLQACELICRKITISPRQLKSFVTSFGFDKTQVDLAIKKFSEAAKEKCLTIYKCFWKLEGTVYVGWYSVDAAEWLKAPAKLFLGITIEDPATVGVIDPMTGQPAEPVMVDADITFYPIFILPYYETEQTKIIDHRGRVYLDNHKQEALTANISQFLNGCQQASTTEISVAAEVARSSEVQSIELGSGKVSPIPLRYYSPPYPDSVMLSLQNYLDSANSQEAGQVNFAANNRKDSRKTATEISAAMNENSMLSSVQVSLYSAFIRQVYTVAWKITQSQALQGKIPFLVDFETGQNNIALIAPEYDLRSAGDVDVIRRQELIAQYKEFWPIMQTTPAATQFLSRLLRLVFLDEGDSYAVIIEQGDPRAIVAQLGMLLSDPGVSAALAAEAAKLPPEQRQTLIQLLEQTKMISETYMAEQIQKNPSTETKMSMQPSMQEGGEDGDGADAENPAEQLTEPA